MGADSRLTGSEFKNVFLKRSSTNFIKSSDSNQRVLFVLMGREEKFPSSGFLPPSICWLTYISVCALFFLLSFYPLFSTLTWNCFLAAILTTLVVFFFAVTYRNTSIYDPYWCWFPIFLGAALLASSQNASYKCWASYVLILIWGSRYNWDIPWEGWTKGIHTEDWRYILLAKDLGLKDSVGFKYWFLVSLVQCHIIPTLLVFIVLLPFIQLFENKAEISAIDFLGIIISLGAILLQHV